MAFRGKRGDTLVNFAFIIGMLLIAIAVTVTLTRFSLFQSRQLETDYLLDFSENIKNTLEKAQSSPNDANFKISLEAPILYKLWVDKGRINLEFPQYTYKTQTLFFSSNTNIIGKNIENSGEILILKRGNTILITDEVTCDTSDPVCDPGCIVQQKCDSACYKDYLNDVCNPYCVDKNNDKIINEKDLDKVCDPDCYGYDMRGTYDPDCLLKNDNVCDPNTDNNPDNFCDNDCLNTNGVCDPDCSQYDADCPHQDNGACEVQRGEKCTNEPDCSCDDNLQTCKGICPGITIQPNGCVNIADMKQSGQDCMQQCQCAPGLVCDTYFGSNKCCPAGQYFDPAQNKCVPNVGDGYCKVAAPFGENCQNSTADCSCTTGGCCPQSSKKDAQGCVEATGIEGESCVCNSECASPLFCNGGACCPAGKEWDGDSCEVIYTYTVLFIQMGGNVPSLDSIAQTATDKWIQLTPLNQCPKRVRAIAETQKICNVDECNPGSAINGLINCANDWGYGGVYTRIVGVLPPPDNCITCLGGGCVGGYTFLYAEATGSVYSKVNFVATHEMGHTFGLCDEPYGIMQSASCPSGWAHPSTGYCCPNAPDGPCIMCSYTNPATGCHAGNTFAADDYAHLHNELDPYCQ